MVYGPPETSGGNPSLYLDFDPGLGNEELLVEADRVPVGHAGKEVPGGGVQALLVNRARVEELPRLLVDLFPQPAEDTARFLELGRRDVVLVNRIEQEAAQPESRLEDPVAHPNLRQPTRETLHHDIGDHPADALRRARAKYGDAFTGQVSFPQQPRAYGIVDVMVHIRDDVGHARDLA